MEAGSPLFDVTLVNPCWWMAYYTALFCRQRLAYQGAPRLPFIHCNTGVPTHTRVH